MAINYYNRRSSSSLDAYSSSSNVGIDLRQELTNSLLGTGENPIAQTGFIRRMRRDSDGNITPCPCVSAVTGEPDKAVLCPVCWGEGVYFDEEFVDLFMVHKEAARKTTMAEQFNEAGHMVIPMVDFYLEYDKDITLEDKVVLLDLGASGEYTTSTERAELYRLSRVWPFRLESGRIEYWKLSAYLHKTKFLNP